MTRWSTCTTLVILLANQAHAEELYRKNPGSNQDSQAAPFLPGRKSARSLPTELPVYTNRVIYLNGSNISSVRGQDLENVNLRIDDHGNIHIVAPHYETFQESTYHPLLPGEIPQFPKAQAVPMPALPQGRFSKERSSEQPQPETTKTDPLPSKTNTEIAPEAVNSEKKEAQPSAPVM